LNQLKQHWIAIGFSSWKKPFITDFLPPESHVSFWSYRKLRAKCKQLSAVKVVVWSSKASPELIAFCNQHCLPLWRMEDGFIRSVGLGVDLVRPVSLVLDSTGIYYDSSSTSDLETMLNTHTFNSSILSRSRELIHLITHSRISKYNIGFSSKLNLPQDKTIILVPGQVEADASILKGSPYMKTNLSLLTTVREQNPDAFIIYKPHPDVLAGGRDGKAFESQLTPYDLRVTDISITDLFEQVDELHTMTSLAGFEALLRGVKVVTYGLPFYAGWGLTTDHCSCDRRQRKLSVEELVAGTLLLYPVYVDPATCQRITCEQAIGSVKSSLGSPKGPRLSTRIDRLVRRTLGMKRV